MGFYGWAGKALYVDLTRSKIVEEPLREDFAHKYIGCRGFGSRIVYDRVGPDVDPLSPSNVLVLSTGLLSGTLAPGSCRFMFTAKSPLTGILGDSNCGGYLGPEVKFAGYDYIVFTGRSDSPVYLWVQDGEAEIRDAKDLWGRTTWETEDEIREELGDARIQVASIGQGGENMVRYASIIHDYGRAAGRTGMGAVMGSKNLKAVAARGHRSVKIKDPKLMREAVEAELELMKKFDSKFKHRAMLNALDIVSSNYRGKLERKNFQESDWYWGWYKLGPLRYHFKHKVKSVACFNCPVPDGSFYATEEGWGAHPKLGAPQWIGFKLMIFEYDRVLNILTLLNQHGLDILNTCGAISWAIDCFERGLITSREVGFKLSWGDGEAVSRLVEMIAKREGFGDKLAEGAVIASKAIGKGSERLVMHVKKMDLISDPRSDWGAALAWSVSNIGADHTRGIYDSHMLKNVSEDEGITDPYSPFGKGMGVKKLEDLMTVLDMTGLCQFYRSIIFPSIERISMMIKAATGFDISPKELLRAGERVYNVEKAFNTREGLSRRDDTQPEKLLEVSRDRGPGKGKAIPLQKMLDDYYRERGWDVKTGLPRGEKLIELGLEDIASDLQLKD